VTQQVFDLVRDIVEKKKPHLATWLGNARLETFCEGLCVQCMHIGPYATEERTLGLIDKFITERGDLICETGVSDAAGMVRRHHEIYLGDPRKGNPATLKTVLRHPVRLK
jgi:hypothetical protein